MTSKSLRVMTEADLDAVIRIHQIAFKGFFLEQMGASLIKAYYKISLSYEGSVAYVYVGKNSCIEGFVVGFVQPSKLHNKIIYSSFQLIFPIFSGVLHNPRLLLKIFENIKRVSNISYSSSKFELNKQTAELSSIAVVTSTKGIGSLLITAFIKDIWSRGLSDITLTTDSEDNERANNFYIKHGFKRNGLEVRRGRNLWRYILTKG